MANRFGCRKKSKSLESEKAKNKDKGESAFVLLNHTQFIIQYKKNKDNILFLKISCLHNLLSYSVFAVFLSLLHPLFGDW